MKKINWKGDEYKFFYLTFYFRINRKIFICEISDKLRMRLWIENNFKLRENNQEI